jgi:hypothetical protein
MIINWRSTMNNSDSNDSDVEATLPPLGVVQEVVPDAGCVEDIATGSAAASSTKPASVTTDGCQKKRKAPPSTAKSAQSKKHDDDGEAKEEKASADDIEEKVKIGNIPNSVRVLSSSGLRSQKMKHNNGTASNFAELMVQQMMADQVYERQ